MQYTNFQTSGAVTNDPIPDKIPVELASLTFDEVRIISRIYPFLKVVILPGGQFGDEGSVIHFPFPVQKVMNHLPRPLSESEVILYHVLDYPSERHFKLCWNKSTKNVCIKH